MFSPGAGPLQEQIKQGLGQLQEQCMRLQEAAEQLWGDTKVRTVSGHSSGTTCATADA